MLGRSLSARTPDGKKDACCHGDKCHDYDGQRMLPCSGHA
jgi:hypothetical protein